MNHRLSKLVELTDDQIQSLLLPTLVSMGDVPQVVNGTTLLIKSKLWILRAKYKPEQYSPSLRVHD